MWYILDTVAYKGFISYYKLFFMIEPIHKFNGGLGATLCNKCRKIITTGFTEDIYCEDCGGRARKYLLTRTRDSRVISGDSILYIEWDELGRFKEKHELPEIDRSLVVDFNGGNFKWMTTKIKEILEMSDNLVRFVTKNSEYILEKNNSEKSKNKEDVENN